MRKLLLIAAVAVVSAACAHAGESTFTLKGRIDGYDGFLLLVQQPGGVEFSPSDADTVWVRNGNVDHSAVFTGSPLGILMSPDGEPGSMFIPEKGELRIDGSVDNRWMKGFVTGGPLNDKVTSIFKKMERGFILSDSLETQIEGLQLMASAYPDFIDENRDNMAGVWIFYLYSFVCSPEEIEKELEQFSPEMRRSTALKAIANMNDL